MANDITSKVRRLIQSARAESNIVDVAKIAEQIHQSFPSYDLRELKNIVFEQAVANGTMTRWE